MSPTRFCGSKKTLKSHTNTFYDTLWHCHYAPTNNRLRRRPPAVLCTLRGLRVEVTVHNLFTTISSKSCTEHVHNFSKPESLDSMPDYGRFSVDFSLQHISSNPFLWKQKRFVGSNAHVILSRQGSARAWLRGRCGKQTPSAFSIRICCMLLTSKCRRKSDLGLYTTSVLANRMPLRVGDFRCRNIFGRKNCRNLPMLRGILFASTDVMHSPRSDCPQAPLWY